MGADMAEAELNKCVLVQGRERELIKISKKKILTYFLPYKVSSNIFD